MAPAQRKPMSVETIIRDVVACCSGLRPGTSTANGIATRAFCRDVNTSTTAEANTKRPNSDGAARLINIRLSPRLNRLNTAWSINAMLIDLRNVEQSSLPGVQLRYSKANFRNLVFKTHIGYAIGRANAKDFVGVVKSDHRRL
jgi:hypothetical protein